jgi:hypothetical protein
MSRRLLTGLALLLSAGILSPRAWAFPENVRHHYVNCQSCHVNPNGTGLLNPYGRQLSKAVQSYGKFFFEPGKVSDAASPPPSKEGEAEVEDKEVEFLYGGLAQPSWLNLGGDIRFLQLYQNTPQFTQARFIVMQLDLEAAVTLGKFTFDGTIGRDDPTYRGVQDPGFSDYVISRRHYVLFQASDEFFLMGGRFWKPYGILEPNHVSFVKRGLGWDFGSESYNIEAGYTGPTYSLMAYGDLGRPDNSLLQIEKGGGATGSVALNDTYKVGASYFYGKTDFGQRHVFGPWAILGFTEHFYLWSENDFVKNYPLPTGTITFGFANNSRLGYEFVQGFHGFIEQQFSQLDFAQDLTRRQIYGVGVLYYPRPHFEFEADYQKQQVLALGANYADYVYFLLHYYL